MKVLVYGAGVIGGQLVHALSKSGNDVTVIARGAWKESFCWMLWGMPIIC